MSYYILKTTFKLCLPFRLCRTTFNRLHDHWHTSIKITHNTFTHYYYMPFLKNGFPLSYMTVLNVNVADILTQRFKQLQSFSEHAPSYKYRNSRDTKGPINPSSQNKSYIHVVFDAFSHFVVTVPIKSSNAKAAVQSVFHH